MNINKVLDILKDKSGTICAAGAVVGVFVTAYLSGKAAVRVEHTIDPDMDTQTKVKEYGKAYWKTAVSAGVTTALIVGSDRIHVSKEIAAAGVAAMWKDKFVTLDKKVTEKIGAEKTAEIHKEIVADKMKEKEIPENLTKPNLPGEPIYVYEPYTEQYFYTTRERIAWAMLKANEKLQKTYDCRLNYIIKLLGGDPDPIGDKIGWNMENDVQDYAWSYYGGPWIELTTDVIKKGEREALALFYMVDPETQEPEDMIYSE